MDSSLLQASAVAFQSVWRISLQGPQLHVQGSVNPAGTSLPISSNECDPRPLRLTARKGKEFSVYLGFFYFQILLFYQENITNQYATPAHSWVFLCRCAEINVEITREHSEQLFPSSILNPQLGTHSFVLSLMCNSLLQINTFVVELYKFVHWSIRF